MSGKLAVAIGKFWAWILVVKTAFGTVAVTVSAAGFRALNPHFAAKLYKQPIPFADWLEADEIGHRIDVAHGTALVFVLVVFSLIARVMRNWLRSDDEQNGWNAEVRRRMSTTLAFLALGADSAVFYRGTTILDWGASSFSEAALLATVAYVVAILGVSYVSVELSQNVQDLTRREQECND